MPKDIYGGLYVHLDKLDNAIEAHNLTEELRDENQSQADGRRKDGQIRGKTKDEDKTAAQRKKEMVIDLEKELLFLGIHEGTTTECRDPQANATDAVDSRGILRKRIKSGLIMEYTFSTQKQTILNFNLNNVSLKLSDIPDDKMIKLLIIVRFFNSVYRQKNKSDKTEEQLSPEEIEKRKRDKIEENKRRLVLSKL